MPARVRPRWWVLPMPVRFTAADRSVDAVRGCVAIERGPLVHAFNRPTRTEHRPDLFGGVTVVRLPGPITAIPYFTWANRGAGPIRVCLPLG